ncbi:hypothetical protein L2E82_43805 [Cichorium intybus]|uniref:Uncharacterized protein n=1 Tax=Cichorium intybus TaxID=13427 RepID=A0ACB8ZQG5_CICIN|nr:hypothetical protein L2E82_43805 [Cichorium intybus]
MEIISSAIDGTLNRSWKRRRYQRFDGGYRRNTKTVTFGGKNRRFWKIKAIPRLRLKKFSPIRFWIKFKNAYLKMMLRLAVTDNIFGSRRVPKRLQISGGYSVEEFQSRLIYEISKNLFPSRELTTI